MKWIILYVVGIVGLDVCPILAQPLPQTQHETTTPSKNFNFLPDQDVRERVLTDAWYAAEAAKSHVEELTERIQQLKRQPQSDPVQIQELEQERLLLLRQHIVAQQFRTIPDRLKSDVQSTIVHQK